MTNRDFRQPGESRRIQVLIIAAFFVVAFALIYLANGYAMEARYQVLRLNDGWDVSYHGASINECALDQTTFIDIRQRDKVTLSTTLPDLETPSGCIYVSTAHASIRAYVNNELIYTSGERYLAENIMTPTYSHLIPLPKGYALKTLSLQLTAGEDNAFSAIQPIYLGNIDDVYTAILQSQRVTVLTGGFLCAFFIVQFFVFLYLALFVRVELRILYSGMVSLLLGVYMLTYYETLSFFSNNLDLNVWLEYGSLFLLPVAVSLFVASIRDGFVRKVSYVAVVVNLMMALAELGAHLTHVVYADALLPVEHGLILSEGLFVMVEILLRGWKNRNAAEPTERWQTSDKALLFGMALMLVFMSIEVVRYNFLRLVGRPDAAAMKLDYITIAALIFIISMLLNIFFYNTEHRHAAQTQNALEGLAYTDPLTELANRGRCELAMAEIEKRGEPYTLISLDVDDLKTVNDKYSHAEGDRLLIESSAILRGAFEDALLIGRMGGDEFVVILPDTSSKQTTEALERLKRAIADKNAEQDEKLTFGMSYGVAYSHEKYARNIADVLAEADQRMYRMKRQRHKERRAS